MGSRWRALHFIELEDVCWWSSGHAQSSGFLFDEGSSSFQVTEDWNVWEKMGMYFLQLFFFFNFLFYLFYYLDVVCICYINAAHMLTQRLMVAKIRWNLVIRFFFFFWGKIWSYFIVGIWVLFDSPVCFCTSSGHCRMNPCPIRAFPLLLLGRRKQL